ncbi:UNVERIFIED_CONTAM: hypothetical protein Slati_1766900 [Sesamum latifolium]|uniref:Uncharacterized protein n=1 Tax=Sesamum latifolium TaxID=2727402 RepID=A0AAW2WY72_9LAMI
MVPRRFDDNSTGGASWKTVILEVSAARSADLGVCCHRCPGKESQGCARDNLQGLGSNDGRLPGLLFVWCVGRSFHNPLTS